MVCSVNQSCDAMAREIVFTPGVIGASTSPDVGLSRIGPAIEPRASGDATMEQYVALDVSLKDISVCIIDSNGEVVFEGKTAAEPATLVELIRSKAAQVKRVGLETGATSPWLFHALVAAGL